MSDRLQAALAIAEAAWDAGVSGGWRRGAAAALRGVRRALAPGFEVTVPPAPDVPPPVATPARPTVPVDASDALAALGDGGTEETAPGDATAVTAPVASWTPPALSEAPADVSSPLHDEVIGRIQTVFDPEIPVNIYELGLIYGVTIDDGAVRVEMTLTSPNCPSAQSLPDEVRTKIADLEGVASVDVEVVWDPPWGPERMSEEARLELNLG